MKKITLLIAALALSMGAFAQDWEFGAKAGINLAKNTKTTGENRRTGFYAGVFAEKVISDYFGVQGELLYSQAGSKAKGSGVSVLLKTNYLALPILAKIYVAPNLSVDLGPQFGYMVSGKLDKLVIYKNLKKFDVSWAAGLSYKISGRYDLSARYNFGLTKVSKDSTVKSKNSVISFGVGYRF